MEVSADVLFSRRALKTPLLDNPANSRVPVDEAGGGGGVRGLLGGRVAVVKQPQVSHEGQNGGGIRRSFPRQGVGLAESFRSRQDIPLLKISEGGRGDSGDFGMHCKMGRFLDHIHYLMRAVTKFKW